MKRVSIKQKQVKEKLIEFGCEARYYSEKEMIVLVEMCVPRCPENAVVVAMEVVYLMSDKHLAACEEISR